MNFTPEVNRRAAECLPGCDMKISFEIEYEKKIGTLVCAAACAAAAAIDNYYYCQSANGGFLYWC